MIQHKIFEKTTFKLGLKVGVNQTVELSYNILSIDKGGKEGGYFLGFNIIMLKV